MDNNSKSLKSLNLYQPGSNVTELYHLKVFRPTGIALHGGHFFALHGNIVIQYQLDTRDDEVSFDVIAWSLDGAESQIRMKEGERIVCQTVLEWLYPYAGTSGWSRGLLWRLEESNPQCEARVGNGCKTPKTTFPRILLLEPPLAGVSNVLLILNMLSMMLKKKI